LSGLGLGQNGLLHPHMLGGIPTGLILGLIRFLTPFVVIHREGKKGVYEKMKRDPDTLSVFIQSFNFF